LKNEFKYICDRLIEPDELENKNKKKKIRRKTIYIVKDEDDEPEEMEIKQFI
jgi:hypothetical protein